MPIQEQMPLSGFAKFLVEQGYLTETKTQLASNEAIKENISFIIYLSQNNFICSRVLAKATANYFDLPSFDLNRYNLRYFQKGILTIEAMRDYFVIPFYRKEQQLLLGVSDPTSSNLNKIHFLPGLMFSMVIVDFKLLIKVIDSLALKLDENMHTHNTALPIFNRNNEKLSHSFSLAEIETAPIVRFINQLIGDAVNKNASDIHFEPYGKYYRIRFRIDGILYEINQQSMDIGNYITARLKIMANLDISERRLPQDGSFKLNHSSSPQTYEMIKEKNQQIDFRLNTCPTLFGEKLVLRILNSSGKTLHISALGMNEIQKALLFNAIAEPQGLILVVGPTGSGKTVTLYSLLNRLNTTQVNICTVEDPPEIYLQGTNQVQINNKIGINFATMLKTFLRQDPDIIMVGEIRDFETAEIAIKAAHTGHLVLSTLHTNSAIETMTRLSHLGITSYNLATSITLIVAQRLVRRLCPICKQAIKIPTDTLLSQEFKKEELENLNLYKPVGCSSCHNGYKGRIGIYEVMPISKEMARLMLKNVTITALENQAQQEKIMTLRSSALEKIKMGITSLEEVNRVIRK